MRAKGPVEMQTVKFQSTPKPDRVHRVELVHAKHNKAEKK